VVGKFLLEGLEFYKDTQMKAYELRHYKTRPIAYRWTEKRQ